jgi:hypothetical protein
MMPQGIIVNLLLKKKGAFLAYTIPAGMYYTLSVIETSIGFLRPLYLTGILGGGSDDGSAFTVYREHKFLSPETHPSIILFNPDDTRRAGRNQGLVASHNPERTLKGFNLELRDFATQNLASKG